MELNIQLALLAAYMHNCPTQAMAAQVVEVCMESLLRIKVIKTRLFKLTIGIVPGDEQRKVV
jgi:hypothetical protein